MLNKSLAVLALGLFSLPAMAGVDQGPPCLDGNNITCITETEIKSGIEYEIDNQSQERIFGFGVTNEASSPRIHTENIGWEGEYVTARDWDGPKGYSFSFYDTTASSVQRLQAHTVWITGNAPEYDGPPVQESLALVEVPVEKTRYVYLGSFAERFGTDLGDNSVAFYWNQYTLDNPLDPTVSLDNFFLGAEENSQFSTFSQFGNVVTTSVSQVPEPETYAMFLAGLGLLGFASRKRKA